MQIFPSTDYPALLGALLVLNWPLYSWIGRQIFRDRKDVKEAVHHGATLSLVSLLRGTYMRDTWAGARIFSWFLISGLLVMFQYFVVCEVIARIYQ